MLPSSLKPGITIGAGLIDPYKLGCATFVACVFVPLMCLSALRTNLQPLPTVNLQVWISTKPPGVDDGAIVGVETSNTSKTSSTAAAEAAQPGITPPTLETEDAISERLEDERETNGASFQSALTHENLPDQLNSTVLEAVSETSGETKVQDDSSSMVVFPQKVDFGTTNLQTSENQMLSQQKLQDRTGNDSTMDNSEAKESAPEQSVNLNTPTTTDSVQDGGAKEDEKSKVDCDFSQVRTDICELHGDVRIHGPSSTVKLIASPQHITLNTVDQDSPASSWKIRPYARKWEGSATLTLVKELTLSVTPPDVEDNGSFRYKCSRHHENIPAVVFSTGGFQGNFFHDLADVMIPLFITTKKYGGEVQFLIEDFKPQWVKKYRALLRQLSRYDVINLDADDKVHCFKDVTVGLKSNQELGVDSDKAPEGPTMLDFRQFLRRSLQLKRDFVLTPPKQLDGSDRKPPRLVIVSRKKTRVLINERQVVRMARRLGYKVIVAGLETMKNLTQMAKIVNSCDVLLGVHGAGLTNMVFLPTNATMIQIVPWGDMKYPCRFSYGDPAVAMGLRYIEYEIGMKETSLIKRYPRNHPVFTDPLSIHKQGFVAIWSTFLNQDVTVDLGKFKGILQQALKSR